MSTVNTEALLRRLLLLALLVRVATLGLYPLTDTTEARYAEIARVMLDSGNWLTPMFDTGVPFWGKPPLSFWLSALCMGVLGVNEFAARLGPLLAALFTLALLRCWPSPTAKTPEKIANNPLFITSALVFITAPLGFISSAAVMTDMAMVAGTTLSMVAFWRALREPRPGYWPWLFFVGQALGLLAKGPVAVVLSGLPIGAWLLWTGAWRECWQRLPWLRGSALTLLLVLPWYWLAERATPGFLQYFIVGEHWYRFTQSGWKGDLYGVAHAQPKGRIWLFALVDVLPWLLPALVWAWAQRRQPADAARTSERTYLLCWMLAPCVFFTMSGNILPAYVLPGLPAFALLVAQLMQGRVERPARGWLLGLCALFTPLAFVALLLFGSARINAASDKVLLQGVAAEQVVYLLQRPESGRFYSHGLARLARTPDVARAALSDASATQLMLPLDKLADWSAVLAQAGWVERARNGPSVAVVRGEVREGSLRDGVPDGAPGGVQGGPPGGVPGAVTR